MRMLLNLFPSGRLHAKKLYYSKLVCILVSRLHVYKEYKPAESQNTLPVKIALTGG